MRLIPRRRKTKPAQAVETVLTAIKFGAIAGAVKGAGKGAGKGAKRATTKTPLLRRAPVVLAAGGAAAVAAKKLRSDGATAQPTQSTGPTTTSATTPG